MHTSSRCYNSSRQQRTASASMSSAFLKALEGVPVADLVQQRELVCIDSNARVSDAVKALDEKWILCAPVRDSATGRYIGLIETSGLVMHVLGALSEGETQTFGDLLLSHSQFGHTTIAELAAQNPSFLKPYEPVQASQITAVSLVQILCNRYRVPIERDGKLLSFVTQTDLIRLLVKHASSWAAIGQQTLSQAGLAATTSSTALVSASTAKHTAWDAFCMMRDHNVGAVPIVDASNCLVGNISAREARYIVREPRLMVMLFGPVSEWIKTKSDGRGSSGVSVTAETTISQVVELMAKEHLHRVYVQDGEHHVLRTLTLGDVINRLAAMH
eukprot:m.83050 g.83050  ORF g.83050 m.83050 type:complete len:330 (+) comp14953_c1_seq1:2-991(+)